MTTCYVKWMCCVLRLFFFFQAEDGIRDDLVTGVQTCALPIFACPLPLCASAAPNTRTCASPSKRKTVRPTDVAYAKSARRPSPQPAKKATGTKKPVLSTTNRYTKKPRSNGLRAPETGSATLGHEEVSDRHARSWLRSLMRFLDFRVTVLRAVSQIVHEQPNQPAHHPQFTHPLQRPLPQFHGQWNPRVLRPTAVKFRLLRILWYMDYPGAA